jgi:hypothetical protein
MYEVTDKMPPHARVVLLEPEVGWSRAFFDREMTQYARDRGAAPRTVTLHPDTMVAFGFASLWALGLSVTTPRGPILVSSLAYARDRITLFE